MTDLQTADPARPIQPIPQREPQSVLPVQSGDVPAVSASGVPITPGDPRFMTRDAQGRLVNPDGSVFVSEDRPRTVQQALADMESEINGVWHATPSGTEGATVRLRALLREIRGFADPNSPQAKADKARAEEAKKAEAVRLAQTGGPGVGPVAGPVSQDSQAIADKRDAEAQAAAEVSAKAQRVNDQRAADDTARARAAGQP